jgi:hypothetical protein
MTASIFHPWLFYDPHRDTDSAVATDTRRREQTEREKRLVCAACGHVVTRLADQTAVNGEHAHTCTNPHGKTFHIGCFREAKGCKAVGPSTDEFTWFAGYVWSVALCRNCDVHLGWLFRSSTDRFFGLILDRLVERAD